MMGNRRWALATLSVTVIATLASCGSPGGQSGVEEPRARLTTAVEEVLPEKSVRFDGEYTSPGTPGAQHYTGGLSWADGTIGEITSSSGPGGAPTTARITKDALYGPIPAGLGGLPGSGLAGKTWFKQSFSDLEQAYGPVGTLIRAVFNQTNPVRSAGLLVQAQDLRDVGEETRNGVSTTHYSGTVEVTKAVADLRLGLDQATLDALGAQHPGGYVEKLDLWLDEGGRPVHAESSATAPADGSRFSADYHDYGSPVTVTAPPADQVADLGQLGDGLLPPSN